MENVVFDSTDSWNFDDFSIFTSNFSWNYCCSLLSCKGKQKKTTSLHSWCKELWNCFEDIFGSTEMEQQVNWTVLSCPSCFWHRRWQGVSKWRQDSLSPSVTSYCQSRLVPMAVGAHMVNIWTNWASRNKPAWWKHICEKTEKAAVRLLLKQP